MNLSKFRKIKTTSNILKQVWNARGTHINYKIGVIFVQTYNFSRMIKAGTSFFQSDFEQFWELLYFLVRFMVFFHSFFQINLSSSHNVLTLPRIRYTKKIGK